MPTSSARYFAARLIDKHAISRPVTTISPWSGRSSPATRLRSVVLPEPDGPLSRTNSPSPTSSETSRNAPTVARSRRYVFETERTDTSGCLLTSFPPTGLLQWTGARDEGSSKPSQRQRLRQRSRRSSPPLPSQSSAQWGQDRPSVRALRKTAAPRQWRPGRQRQRFLTPSRTRRQTQ